MLSMNSARFRRVIAAACLYLIIGVSHQSNAAASKEWEAIDKRVKSQVYQVNVAIKVKLKDGVYAQLADLSRRRRYPVFATTANDQGFRVIGHGTCFPVIAAKRDRTYLLTNKHVVEFGPGMLQECQRFFCGMRLYADRSAGFNSPESRYKDLARIVNLCTKKDATNTEREMYAATVDTIWDTYDTHLSLKADPKRTAFNKYLAKTGLKGEIGYFVHAPGSLTQPPMVAELYRAAKLEREPDLAILAVKKVMPALELEPATPVEGEQVQTAGYPIAAKSGKAGVMPYSPSFSNGKIVRITPSLVHFDASVSKGDSGGPLLNKHGKVLGVVARRAMPDISTDRYAGAISVKAVKGFAPELFGKPAQKK